MPDRDRSRIAGLLVLAASAALSACGGGGAPTTATPATAPTSSANAYTGPAPATADVQAFAVNFWANVRVQNRCGQCHNATSPAQMPNFARSDDVNLAYAQANTVVNLQQPSDFADRDQGQRRAQLLAGRSQRLRRHLDDLDQQLGRRLGRRHGHPGAAHRAAGANRGIEQELPRLDRRISRPMFTRRCSSPVLLRLPFAGCGHAAVAVLRLVRPRSGLSVRDSEDESEHARQFALRQPSGRRYAQLLGRVRQHRN